jgi:CheY-like chemotaxis protein
MVFGAHADISLVAARSFDDAVAAARSAGARPDLIIADVGLGNRSGYDLCATVKADPGLRGVPVFILASSHTPYDEGKGRDAGADGHLIKPFESQGLIDKVNDILSRPVPVAPPVRDPHLAATPAMARTAARPGPAVAPAVIDDDDEYGDFKIERSSGSIAVPASLRSAPPPASAAPVPPSASRPANLGPPAVAPAYRPAPGPAFPPAAPPAAGLRPSLIPGTRPGMVPGRLPLPGGTPGPAPYVPGPSAHAPPAASRSPGAAAPSAPAGYGLGGAAPVAHTPPAAGRTIMGLPAVAIPGMAPRSPQGGSPSPAAPAPTPGMPAARPQPAAVAPPVQAKPAIDIGAAISARVGERIEQRIDQRLDQKMTAIAARGPEYEAIAKLSREVIEQVVWEVVPELAEIIIREHVERLASSRK